MFDELIRRWWIVAGRGLVAVVLGVAFFMEGARTVGLIVSLFGVFAFADGVFTVGAGLAVSWLPLFLEGIFGMVVGAFTFLYPPAAQLWFMELIVGWAVVTGVLELVGVRRLRRVAKGAMAQGAWLLSLSGMASVLFGVLVALRPEAPIEAFSTLLGVYAVLSGALLLFLSLNVRHWPHLVPPAAPAH